MKEHFLAIAALLGFLFGFLTGFSLTNSHWKAEAISRGFAQYCPLLGEWAWN